MKKQIISTKIVGWTTMLVFPLALTILTLRLMGAAAAPAATDFLDSDFDGDGRVTIPISGSSQIGREMAIQPDGKLIIAGYDKWQTSNTDAILARVNPDGSLDGTFGAGGVVTTAFSSGNDAAYAVAAQQDGKIVAAGYTTAGSHSVAVVMRYNADGSLDNSFGNNGVVTTSLQPDNSWFLSVAVLDDGRIVAGGTVDSNPDAFLLTRYQANGAPDTTLGGSGVVTTTIPGGDAASWDMALQPDGKIILAGFFRPSGLGTDFALIRYNTDGSLDAGFGAGGVVTQNLTLYDYGYGVGVQSDGKIVLGGLAGSAGSLARYNADGSYDDSFGSLTSTNFVTTPVPGYASSVFIETALLDDDGIVAATRASGAPAVVAVTVFNRDGRLNPFFGTNGIVTTTNETHIASSYAILVQPDRKIVLAGHVDMDDTSGYDYDLALWRYLPPQKKIFLPLVTR